VSEAGDVVVPDPLRKLTATVTAVVPTSLTMQLMVVPAAESTMGVLYVPPNTGVASPRSTIMSVERMR
jgi:hypothetical protein